MTLKLHLLSDEAIETQNHKDYEKYLIRSDIKKFKLSDIVNKIDPINPLLIKPKL